MEEKRDNFLLKGIPPILWINLDRSKDRYKYMNNLFKQYNLHNKRILGCDGNNYKDFCIIDENTISNNNNKTSYYEYGCLCSHLKSIEYFASSNDLGDYCLIAEDDLSLEYLQYWNKNFWNYINECPKDFEIIQLSQIYNNMKSLNKNLQGEKILTIRKYEQDIYGTGIYLITKKCAEKIVNKFIKKIDNKFDLNYMKQFCYNNRFKKYTFVSDYFLYKHNITYTIPLFTISNLNQSNVQNINEIPSAHLKSKEFITQLLENKK